MSGWLVSPIGAGTNMHLGFANASCGLSPGHVRSEHSLTQSVRPSNVAKCSSSWHGGLLYLAITNGTSNKSLHMGMPWKMSGNTKNLAPKLSHHSVLYASNEPNSISLDKLPSCFWVMPGKSNVLDKWYSAFLELLGFSLAAAIWA